MSFVQMIYLELDSWQSPQSAIVSCNPPMKMGYSLLRLVKNLKIEDHKMPYTTEDGGRLNNFAIEPKMYQAEPPTADQKRNYLIMGILGIALISGLIYVAVLASSAS
jgi:hypothetical protein